MTHAEPDWRSKRQAIQDALAAGRAGDLLRHAEALIALGRATDVAYCASVFQKASSLLLRSGHRALKTFIVRSVTIEPMLPALHVQAVLSGYVLQVEVGGYGSYMDELLNPEGSLGQSDAELVFILLDGEDIAGQLRDACVSGDPGQIEKELETSVAQVSQMIQSYRSAHAGRMVVSGGLLPEMSSLGQVGEANSRYGIVNTLRILNARLVDICRCVSDCVFFDLDAIASHYGKDRWRDQRMFLASRLPVSSGAFTTYARGLMRSASSLFRSPRKVLCTDLDNTFWGGVLGEEGPEGIETGSAFPGNCFLEYQRHLKELAARGVLLAIVSKNNEADVAEAFRLRSADLALNLEDFVARKISWNEKSDALQELAAELSLGLDSFVFIDDNPAECEAIRQRHPQVAVIQFPANEPWTLPALLADQWLFDAVAVTADDRNRSQEYKAQVQRQAHASSATNRDEFLQSLDIVCTFLGAEDAPLTRSVQLLSKTNQFNLTTRRHSATEVMHFVSDPKCQAIAIRVRDRFGDAGVVGLALTRQIGDECWIDSFLLSCRVIGRGIETALLSQLASGAVSMGSKWLVGEYIATTKNVPCKDFYPLHGFQRSADTDNSMVYRLDVSGRQPLIPQWLSVEEKGNL